MKFSLPPPPQPPLRPPAPPLLRRAGRPRFFSPRKPLLPPPAPALLGCWSDPNGSEQVEFRADGALLEKSATGDKIQGRYLVEDNQLTIQLDDAELLTFTFAVKGRTLELIDADGQVTRYARV